MRPVNKGDSPINTNFKEYRKALPFLIGRLGGYCSYCERTIKTNLSVEHIQPKGLKKYENLTGDWNNFLLSCVNCNSTKKDKEVKLVDCVLPDRDNTSAAYEYSADGDMRTSPSLKKRQKSMAEATLKLVGLDKKVNIAFGNGKEVAIDRVGQRMETWGIAEASKMLLAASRCVAMKRQIVMTALAAGHFSIWMTVFDDDAEMRHAFIHEFPNTSAVCFDADARPESPRANDHNLANGSKL